MLEHVDALFDAHATDGMLAMPYVTECFRAVRRSTGARACWTPSRHA